MWRNAIAQWPSPSCRPSPSLPPPRCCTIHCRCRHAIHHCCCRRVSVAPSITVAAVPSIAGTHCRRNIYHRCCLTISLSVVIDSSPLLPHFLLVINASLFRLIGGSIYCASIGGDGSVLFVSPPISSDGTVVVIVALVIVLLYSLPEAPLPHVSISNWQAFDLIWMHINLLRHVGK